MGMAGTVCRDSWPISGATGTGTTWGDAVTSLTKGGAGAGRESQQQAGY